MRKSNSMKMNNFTPDYTLMKHQLESFYFIPVDRIVTAIMNDPATQNADASVLLETAFKHVFEGAAHYYDFIVSSSIHTFFNEMPGSKQRLGLCQLIYSSLQNNCILNAFFNELACKSKPVDISGKNQPLFEKHIINAMFSAQSINHLKGEVNSQFFNNRKNIFRKGINDGTYINSILQSLNIPDNTQIEPLPIRTLSYLAPASFFLFTEDVCTKFSYSLMNNTNILDKYYNLAEKYYEHKEAYDSPVDRLIFEAEAEAIWGFSFFMSICSDIEDIHNMPLSAEKNLKDLEGQLFINIISQVASLPLFFDKKLFYKYICHAFLSKNIDNSYFEEYAKDVATMIHNPHSKFQQVSTGLELMHNFLRILSSSSIPMLYSLWKVVIHELIEKGLFTEPEIRDVYQDYLTANYSVVTYDYGQFTDEEISKWGSGYHNPEKRINTEYLREHIHENKKINADTNAISRTSKYTNEVMQQLLLSYCRIDSLKENRCPLFFLSGEALAAYSPLTKLITSLQYDPKHYRTHDYYVETDFLINYKKALFNVLLSRD